MGLSQKAEKKQSWAIKIKKTTGEILLGVCLRSAISYGRFNSQSMRLAETGQGCYAINSEGWTFSHVLKK